MFRFIALFEAEQEKCERTTSVVFSISKYPTHHPRVMDHLPRLRGRGRLRGVQTLVDLEKVPFSVKKIFVPFDMKILSPRNKFGGNS